MNEYAYHFKRQDLFEFFQSRGYEVTVLYDADPVDPWGDWYVRFLARKIAVPRTSVPGTSM